MTTGRINQIATRQPIEALPSRRRESRDVHSISGSGFSRQVLRAGLPFTALSVRPTAAVGRLCQGVSASPPFDHHPTPRFRGRDSRSRSSKTFTRDQHFRSDLFLSLEPRQTCTMACGRNVPIAFNVGTTPCFWPVSERPRGFGKGTSHRSKPTLSLPGGRRRRESMQPRGPDSLEDRQSKPPAPHVYRFGTCGRPLTYRFSSEFRAMATGGGTAPYATYSCHLTTTTRTR